MNKIFKDLVSSISNRPYIDKDVTVKFLKRIGDELPLTKPDSFYDHFCSFFVPVDRKNKLVYLGHHIKARDWIPPGGHIEKNENPKDTVIREFSEELNFNLKDEPIQLFNISITDLAPNPLHKCVRHYDFWFAVFIDKTDFVYLKKEYHDAGWFTFEEALKKTKTLHYSKIVQELKSLL